MVYMCAVCGIFVYMCVVCGMCVCGVCVCVMFVYVQCVTCSGSWEVAEKGLELRTGSGFSDMILPLVSDM